MLRWFHPDNVYSNSRLDIYLYIEYHMKYPSIIQFSLILVVNHKRGIEYHFRNTDKRFKDLEPLNNLSTSG